MRAQCANRFFPPCREIPSELMTILRARGLPRRTADGELDIGVTVEVSCRPCRESARHSEASSAQSGLLEST